MRRRQPHRSRPLIWLVAILLTLATPARAQAVDGAPSLADLLAAFALVYEPHPELKDAAFQVAALGRHAELESLPSLSLTERVSWVDYDRLQLDVDLSLQLPLLRTKGAPLAQLQAQRQLLLNAETALSQAEARHRFTMDLLTLALLRSATHDTDMALKRLQDTPWSPPTEVTAALALPAQQREVLAAYWRVASLNSFAGGQLPLFEQRVATALGQVNAPPHLPSFDDLVSHATARGAGQPSCARPSPQEHQAHLRHRQQQLEARAQGALDLRVDLNGGVAYRNGDLSATIGLEARLPLPAAAPVAGQVGVAAHQGGAEQTLRLSWPAPPPSIRPVEATELQAQLAEELTVIKLNLQAARHAATAAASEVDATELQLLWAALDLRGWQQGDDLVTARALAYARSTDPLVELHLLPLRVDVAFARLNLAERLLELELLCGVS